MTRSIAIAELVAMLAAGLVCSILLFDGGTTGPLLSVTLPFATAMTIWIVVQDFRYFIIPDGPLIALGMTGVVVRLAAVPDAWSGGLSFLLVDAAACGGVFLVVREVFFRVRGYDGMGFGDVKLAAVCGILVGCEGFAWSVFAASALGLVFAVGLAVIRPDKCLERLPFGALLAPVCWSMWVMKMAGVL